MRLNAAYRTAVVNSACSITLLTVSHFNTVIIMSIRLTVQ